MRSLCCSNGFWRARRDDHTAAIAAFRPHVDDPIGGLDHVKIVFDDNNRVAVITQSVEHFQQQINVGEMQASGRFVEDIERVAGIAF